MEKRTQPSWYVQRSRPAAVLKLFNSLTRKKEVFVPRNDKTVWWYCCGPTVYDAAHVGHARTYVSFDILRRILTNYFGYNVVYVMNVTDIDDKIINRVKKEYLFEKYTNELGFKSVEEVIEDVKGSLDGLIEEAKICRDEERREMLIGLADGIDKSVSKLSFMLRENDESLGEDSLLELLTTAREPLINFLEKKLYISLDNSVFADFSKEWECKFNQDMSSLNVLPPTVVTRVSDYIPEIIEYIKKIVDAGMAYESKGSVYFSVATFDSMENHFYAKLIPEAYGGATSKCQEGDTSDQSGKKSPADFALWKSSKSGEPYWLSPWGRGRPGWHIECSAMASRVCGDTLDIHSGGEDLKFPHHDNELAQSEAYFGTDSWVQFFVHSGHLTIAGRKMSKSLKNFIKITDALREYSPRQLRLAFILHSWKDPMDYGQNTMEIALTYEKMFTEFFLTVNDMIRSTNNQPLPTKWNKTDEKMHSTLLETKEAVHAALCDNIDTRSCSQRLKECISQCYIYINNTNVNIGLVKDVAMYTMNILRLFGVIVEEDIIGFRSKTDADLCPEYLIMPYLEVLSDFRDNVRTRAKASRNLEMLELCDQVRDVTLPELGVKLEDRDGKPSVIKLADREYLLTERKKDDKLKCVDNEGVPTHDGEGKPLHKKKQRKLKKVQIKNIPYASNQSSSKF